MKPLVTPDLMRKIDAAASSKYRFPTILLMENAGRAVVEETERAAGPLEEKRVLVVCGKGNNGGDGFAAARHAAHRGARVSVLFPGDRRDLKGDALTQFDALANSGDGRVTIARSIPAIGTISGSWDVAIDAMFGTAFRGSLSGVWLRAARYINGLKRSTVVAIDIPSGVDGSSGSVQGEAVRADLTVTLGLPKAGLYFGAARDHVGRIVVADIHFPPPALAIASKSPLLVEAGDVRAGLPVRLSTAHKHSVGKILAVAGSRGLTGAALLTTRAAMSAGAGAVILGIPSEVLPAVAKRTLEVMPFPLPSTQEGSIAPSALKELAARIRWSDVVLIGPGLSQSGPTKMFVRTLLETTRKHVVCDADGLNALAGNVKLLLRRPKGKTILTPHLGEFSRLSGETTAAIARDPLLHARRFAARYGVVLVLKGAPTVIAGAAGELYVNPTGNPGMATAGAGDVLTGTIAAFCAGGNDPLTAAINGVYIHGLAGDRAAHRLGEMSMVAGDILREIPAAIKTVRNERT